MSVACPFLAWPKGAKTVEYLHGAVFYVAGQVIGESGDTLYLNSNNYRRTGRAAIASIGTHWYSFMPLPKYFNNHQTGSVTWDMEGISEDVGEDGLPETHDTGEGDGKLQPEEDFNRNGKLDVSMVNGAGWFSFSHKRETWPRVWPQGSYPGDVRQPGAADPDVRSAAGTASMVHTSVPIRNPIRSWMTARTTSIRTIRSPMRIHGRPFPNGRRGLGITVSTRSYQWSSPLAEDILITTYDITNNGKNSAQMRGGDVRRSRHGRKPRRGRRIVRQTAGHHLYLDQRSLTQRSEGRVLRFCIPRKPRDRQRRDRQ